MPGETVNLLMHAATRVKDIAADRDAIRETSKANAVKLAELRSSSACTEAILKSTIERLNAEIEALKKLAANADLVAEMAEERDYAISERKEAERIATDRQSKFDLLIRQRDYLLTIAPPQLTAFGSEYPLE